MSIKSGLKKIVEALGGSATGKSIPGLLKDIIKAIGGEPKGKNIPDLLSDISENTGISPELMVSEQKALYKWSLDHLLNQVIIPEEATSVGDSVFINKSTVKNVVFLGTTDVGRTAFYNCSSLETVEFRHGFRSIGSSAFGKCSSLKSVVFQSPIGTISGGTFDGCSALKSVTMNSVTPPTFNGGELYGIASDAVIYVPAESVEAYKSMTGPWQDYKDMIQPIPES